MLFGYSAMPQYCTAAKATGFDYVELPGKVIAAITNKEFAAFEKDLDIPALAMNAFCPAEIVITGPGYNRTANIEYAKHLSARASALSVKVIGIGSPMSRNLPVGFDPLLAKRQISEFLLDTAEIFGKYGIQTCFEALADCYCNTVNTLQEALELVRNLNNTNIHVVLDFYNMEHMGEADLPIPKASIIHAHISDDDGNPRLRSYLHPNKQELHQARIRNLLQTGYTGGLTLEVDVPYDPVRAAKSLAIMRGV